MYFNKPEFFLADESATQQAAVALADICRQLNGFEQGWMVYLEGDLGAGKSFLSRAFIQTFLPQQKVKSPTYTLVESYETTLGVIHHFDLYRLCDPEELEFLAIRDLLSGSHIALVEWPCKGAGVLPVADLTLRLKRAENIETVGRFLSLEAGTTKGIQAVKNFTESFGTFLV